MKKEVEISANKWIEKDRKVWVKAMPSYPNQFQDAFLEGKVIDFDHKEVTIDLTDSSTRVKSSLHDILKLTYGPNDVSDMVDLQQLNEPQLLFNIKRRYVNDQIFTYCGPTLLIINPYIKIQKLFNDSVLQEYQSMVFTDSLEYKSLAPHVFGLAAFCLWQLFDNQRNQSIVISGESGAGKTQNTKYCLKFLASLGKNMKELVESNNKPASNQSPSKNSLRKINYQNMRVAEKAIKKTSNKVFGIEEKILGCNEILQAFGNSKTIRNDNSSRFGKLILLVYGETQIDIKSAFIISYLLEKSRIVSVSDGERNYHVFYYFCKGTTKQQKQRYLLTKPIHEYYYLNQSTVYDVPRVSDEEKFAEIKSQFDMYLTPQETDCVYRIISIVLNLGNLVFKKGQTKNNQEMAIITNEEYALNVVKLLEIDFEKFKHHLQYKQLKSGMNIINTPLKFNEALALRDSFSKNIYEKVFNFLVAKLNEKIEIEKIDFASESQRQRKSIGLLDIFGFEVLLINSLEQFFINFANEKLQQLYVSYIFKEEQNQILRQGLEDFSQDIGFQDNKPIIDLFESYPLGIFSLVNESSKLDRPDEHLPSTIVKNHPKTSVIQIPKSKRGFFQINHSCSPVSYNTDGFSAKNKDQFPRQMLEVIKQTKNSTMKSIILADTEATEAKGNKAASKFLGSKFLNEMNKLTEELYSCDCHFVRCIKPNSKKAPKLFNSEAVLQSLRYLGVLDSIIIRKLGYIYRRPFKEFFKKFFEIENYIFHYQYMIQGKEQEDIKQDCKRIADKYASKELQTKNILFGNKKILIKQSALNFLELLTKEKRKHRIHTANKAKIMYKNAKFRGQVKKFNQRIALLKSSLIKVLTQTRQNIINKKTGKIQRFIRAFIWKQRLEKIKQNGTKSVTKISAYYKMKKQRKKFLQIKEKAIRLQANLTTFIRMGRYFRQKACRQIVFSCFEKAWNEVEQKSALLIQRTWRGYKVRKQFQQIIKLMKIRSFLKRAIIKFRFNSFKEMLMRYKKPIMKMQAVVRGRYLRRIFLQARKSAIIIQKAYRRHLHKKFYLQNQWKKYRANLKICEEQKKRELIHLGVNHKIKAKKINLNETVGIVSKLYPHTLCTKYMPEVKDERRDMRINQTISFVDKNTMQCYISDLDIISTISYGGNWMNKYAETKQIMSQKGEYPLKVVIGDNYTLVYSNKDRIYTFGGEENDHFARMDTKSTGQSIFVNGQSNYLLTKDQKLFVWGDNKNSELMISKKEVQVKYLENTDLKTVKQVESRGNYSYYVDKEGKGHQSYQSKITPLSLPNKAQVSQIISSFTFTHFLTTSGQLYSKGSNRYGEIGIGERTKDQIMQPILNQYLAQKKEMVENVSVGMGHTVVRTKLGYAYAWGDNRFGQIVYDKIETIDIPFPIEIQKQKVKVLQAVAGLRNTFLLLQNFKIYGLGTSTSFPTPQNSDFFIQDLLQVSNLNSKNLIPIKISVSWTKQMSVLFVNCLEQSKCKAGTKPDVIYKYCKVMSREWQEKKIYPIYHEWTDNILNISDLRKFKFQNQNSKGRTTANSSKMIESDLEEIKLLMNLRKTSTLFKTAARRKIELVLRELQKKPIEEWNREDKQLNTYIRENCKNALK